jgi:hypothetical protein
MRSQRWQKQVVSGPHEYRYMYLSNGSQYKEGEELVHFCGLLND